MRQRQASDTPDHYADLHGRFGWQVPRRFNMAAVCSRRWAADPATAQQTAVIATAPGQPDRHHSYAELQQQANRLSSALAALGVRRGDRVAIVMPQRFETAVAYMAVLQMGAVGMPLSQLFGPEALEFRLQDSEAVTAICDASTLAAVQSVAGQCPQLRALIAVEAPAPGALAWSDLLASASARFKAVDTLADEAAVLIYTSGTTGNPKGALIPHRALIGNLTGFVCSQNWFGFDPFDATKPSQAVFWSPADWAWTGGLMDALLPTLYFGRPIVAHNGRFGPQMAFELIERHGVTHSFLFPTALKAMMKAYPRPTQHFRFRLEAIMSAGEAVGDAVFAYCREQLGVVVNEMFGQTEINYIVGNCDRLYPARPGSMGKAYPGHRVAVNRHHRLAVVALGQLLLQPLQLPFQATQGMAQLLMCGGGAASQQQGDEQQGGADGQHGHSFGIRATDYSRGLVGGVPRSSPARRSSPSATRASVAGWLRLRRTPCGAANWPAAKCSPLATPTSRALAASANS